MNGLTYVIYGYYALAGFFMLLGVSHRADETKDGPTYIFPWMFSWAGFAGLAAIVALLLAHFLVPVLTFPTLNVTQRIVNGSVSIRAHWYYPEGGGFADAGWWVFFYAVLGGLGPLTAYWAGWHLADFALQRMPHPVFAIDREVITRVVSPPARRGGGDGAEFTPVSLATVIGDLPGGEEYE